MPLPENSKFSLQGHQRPGDLNPAQSAKPKQAMVIRLTAEVLEALEAFPDISKLEVEFGERPTLHVGEQAYPMKAAKENCPHDVYLRTYTAAKPVAPLRLHANVTGKFMVQASLDKAVEHIQSNKKRAEATKGRGVVSIDAPPPTAPTASGTSRKKKTASNMFRKPHPQPDYIKVPGSTATPSASQSSTPKPPPSPSKPIDPSLKPRLIKCLARQPRSTDDVLRALSDGDRASVLRLLKEVGEQSKDKMWTLSTQSWLQVRPFEWEKCTEAERVSMARQGRLALAALKIPESDSVWDHFRPRPSTPVLTPNVAQVAPSRPVTSGKKTVLPKSEAPAAVPKEAKPSAPRRPGSGYQAKRTAQTETPSPKLGVQSIVAQPQEPSSSNAPAPHPVVSRKTVMPPKRPTPPVTHTKSSSTSSTKGKESLPPRPSTKHSVKREDDEEEEGEVESDGDYRTKRSRSGSRTREQETKRPRPRSPDRERALKRPRSRSPGTSVDERRGRDSKDRVRREGDSKNEVRRDVEGKVKVRREGDERARALPESKNRDPDPRKDSATVAKRKPVREDNTGSPAPKKRRTEDGAVPARDLSFLPKKPEPSPSQSSQPRSTPIQKVKKEPATSRPPLPPPAASNSAAPRKTAKRRLDAHYTSSSDEGEIKPVAPNKKAILSNTTKPPRPTPVKLEASSSSSLSPPATAPSAIRKNHSRPPLPTDRKALRARYKRTYSDYILAYADISRQRSLISGLEDGSGDEIDVGDEIKDPEELERMREQHDVLKRELEAIQNALGLPAVSP